MLLLISTTLPDVMSAHLLDWTEATDKRYFLKILRGLHSKRLIEFTESSDKVQILPPGTKYVEELVRKKNLKSIF